ncbi:hypothetical protein GTU79_08780 [Sodalis ligni]|uniref:hypothetical protein n=1 Tax=Sodalis ligni TaxID=2697027 RepID=UPI00193F12FE|nr:hypothetical protein [Sodalis ligni]QWA12768.1 hypothetical protein GTU79_08780 [Sodalis ligni]
MKNRPIQQAANQNSNGSDFTLTSTIKPTPKKHRARRYMLYSGVNGFTENEILRYCRLSSGRNYATEIERQLNITLERFDEPNTDGIGSHFRYRINTRASALKIIDLMRYHAFVGGYSGLSREDVIDILDLYPDELKAD